MTHSLTKTIDREYQHMKDRGWDRIFLFFDLHGTVIKPNYQEGNVVLDYYPYAKETLQLLSKQTDVDLNIYTCSHEHEIIEYQRLFKEDGINFKYVNENPDVPTNGYGNYDVKPYMNILFEDKAGFFGETDWEPIYYHFRMMYMKLPPYFDKNGDEIKMDDLLKVNGERVRRVYYTALYPHPIHAKLLPFHEDTFIGEFDSNNLEIVGRYEESR